MQNLTGVRKPFAQEATEFSKVQRAKAGPERGDLNFVIFVTSCAKGRLCALL
jgi:hypothetical protein